MKMTRKQLRKLIEMAYKGHLGVIDDEGEIKKFSETGEISGALYTGLDSLTPDYDEWEASKPEGEGWEDVEDRVVSKQRRAAKAYASSSHFSKEAEKFYDRLEADIWVMTKIGYFTKFEEIPGIDSSFIDFKDGTDYDQLRTLYFDLNEKSINFLKSVASSEEMKSNIDNVSPSDTVIFFSTDAVGNKSFLIKNTPWILFHSMIHDTMKMYELYEMFSEFTRSMNRGDFGSIGNQYFLFSKPVESILTMKTARDQLATIEKDGNWTPDEYNYFSDDHYVEMIVQELLGKRGLVLKTSGLPQEEVTFINEVVIPGVKKYAAMMREKIKGKLIVVKGTG